MDCKGGVVYILKQAGEKKVRWRVVRQAISVRVSDQKCANTL